ncbi:MAG: choice-of-anchor B family protein [Phycisphaerales bacterium]|nr:choice-of-anchor B family protein [Phycisphaerales bacterium]
MSHAVRAVVFALFAAPALLGAPAVNTGERDPEGMHMCGCGAGCGCGDACGCSDSTVIGQPDPAGLSGYASQDVILLSRISLPEFGSQFQSGNDCWGYVSPSGREYAIMGLSHGAAFVEVTDPTSPQIINIISHPGSLWGDIKVHGAYAYVVNESGGGLQVVDMTQIDQGVVTLAATVTLNGLLSTTHNLAVDNDSARLYLCGANAPTSGLVIFSLANPAAPAFLGTYSGVYVHDAHVVTYTDGPHAGKQIAYCFVGDRGIDIVDVTNPGATVRLSRTAYSGLSYSHQGWVDVERQILFMDDELDEGGAVAVTTSRVFNVANLAAPQYLGSFTSGLPAIDHNQYFHEGFVYQANYRSGLRIFDVRTSVTNPPQVGWFDTYAPDDNANFNGAWSVFPFLPSGVTLVSDIEGGLFILDPRFALTGGIPFIIEPDDAPSTIEPVGAAVSVVITPQNGAALDPASPPTLRLDRGSGFESFPMQHAGGGVWVAAFPALACNTEVPYYFSATSTTGVTINDPLSAPGDTYSAVVASFETVTIEDTLEAASGWTVGAPGDNAVTGVWVRADPVGTAAQPEDDHTPIGTICYVTGNAAPGASIGTNDVDGGSTTLTSPNFDALTSPGGGDAFISYWRWYSNDQGPEPGTDTMPVLISNNGGASWTQLELVNENANAWVRRTFRIADFVEPSAQVRLRFIARDLGAGSIVEAAVDDVQVYFRGCDATAVPGDTNGDGVVDFADLNNVLSTFNQTGSGLIGDVDGDGDVDFGDLNLVLGSFNQA